MVANVEQHNNIIPRSDPRPEHQHQQQQQPQAAQQTQRQQNLQEQRQRLNQERQILEQELRRIQRRQESLRQQAQSERRRRQRERRQQRLREWLESQNLTYEQWIEQQNQERAQRWQWRYDREEGRERQQREDWEHEQYLLSRSPGFDEALDEILTERDLDQYYLERMSPKERQAIWEQEQLNELKGNPTSRPDGILIDDFERYATFQQQQLHNDELEQIRNIEEMEQWDRLQEHNRNKEQLIQKKQWEEIEFLHQQLQQPIYY